MFLLIGKIYLLAGGFWATKKAIIFSNRRRRLKCFRGTTPIDRNSVRFQHLRRNTASLVTVRKPVRTYGQLAFSWLLKGELAKAHIPFRTKQRLSECNRLALSLSLHLLYCAKDYTIFTDLSRAKIRKIKKLFSCGLYMQHQNQSLQFAYEKLISAKTQ